jgi:hypothetical protein
MTVTVRKKDLLDWKRPDLPAPPDLLSINSHAGRLPLHHP